MNSSQNLTPQIAAAMLQIEKFGFKFFGYGENNDPLVIAPNGQIIPLKVAYEFVQQQIQRANQQQTNGGSLESMPVIPQIPDSQPIGVNLEKSPEKEQSIEKTQEKQSNQTQVSTSVQQAGDVETKKDTSTKMPSVPFDEGFKIKTFDPTDVEQAKNFVQSNSSASNQSSNKWLSIQFEKFLKEYQLKSSKK